MKRSTLAVILLGVAAGGVAAVALTSKKGPPPYPTLYLVLAPGTNMTIGSSADLLIAESMARGAGPGAHVVGVVNGVLETFYTVSAASKGWT